jgi:ribonuclease HI
LSILYIFKILKLWWLYIEIILTRNLGKSTISFILYGRGDREVQRTTRLLNKNDTTNNGAHYHALIEGVYAAKTHKDYKIEMFTNYELIRKKMLDECKGKAKHHIQLHSVAKDISKHFYIFHIHHNGKEGYHVEAKHVCSSLVFNFSNANIGY